MWPEFLCFPSFGFLLPSGPFPPICTVFISPEHRLRGPDQGILSFCLSPSRGCRKSQPWSWIHFDLFSSSARFITCRSTASGSSSLCKAANRFLFTPNRAPTTAPNFQKSYNSKKHRNEKRSSRAAGNSSSSIRAVASIYPSCRSFRESFGAKTPTLLRSRPSPPPLLRRSPRSRNGRTHGSGQR